MEGRPFNAVRQILALPRWIRHIRAMKIQRICVFCGASQSATPEHLALATTFGKEMGRRGLELVYGAGRTGLMGAVADAVLSSGGTAFGVIPTFLKTVELAHPGLTHLHESTSMHERKALMAERADAFVSLPGGFGTLDETFEILTWRQLDLHNKPVLLLNHNGFYDGLLQFVQTAQQHGLVRPQHSKLLQIATTQEEVFSLLDL
jgi:uncharacterized protein (TIGR00730 family)